MIKNLRELLPGVLFILFAMIVVALLGPVPNGVIF